MGNTLSNSAIRHTDWLVITGASLFIVWLVLRSRSRATQVRGPPRESFLLGQGKLLRDAEDAAADIQEDWIEKYGMVFNRPGPLGDDVIVIADPKAITHIFSGFETIYGSSKFRWREVGELIGYTSIISVHGNDHKRQRKAMAPGFSNVKLREYTTIFFDSAYKVKETWDAMLEDVDSVELNVTPWMNAISLDSMGLAGFSHDFKSLDGERSVLRDLFDAFASAPMTVASILVFLAGPALPFLSRLPTARAQLRSRFSAESAVIARDLIDRATQGEGSVSKDDKSILGLLVKAQSTSTGFHMTEDEVNSQMKTLMLAGYETTSVTMTWALIELCRRPDIQMKLRNELQASYPSSDPSWDELNGQELPLLDAVVHETLRLHPAVPETARMAISDDIVPLGTPLALPNGQTTDHLVITPGTNIAIPVMVVNRLRSLWGPDAHEFNPERWLDSGAGIPAAGKQIQGHKHLLTFIDGPRNCLGKGFALAETKATLAVLIRNYEFELPSGPKTPIRKDQALVSRPTVEGQPRTTVPLRVRRVEQD